MVCIVDHYFVVCLFLLKVKMCFCLPCKYEMSYFKDHVCVMWSCFLFCFFTPLSGNFQGFHQNHMAWKCLLKKIIKKKAEEGVT